MDSFSKNIGPSPTVPAQSSSSIPHNPSSFSIAPFLPTPPVTNIATPPPLMSITTYPDLQSGMNSPPRKTRRKFVVNNDFVSSFDNREENWAKYYIITKKEGNFSMTSPFLYCQQIIKAVGKPKLIQKMASGALTIEAASKAQAQILRELKMLGDEEIIVESNKRRNTSRGVVVCRDFMVCSEEELKVGMADQGVIEVRRINRRQGGTLVATASLILTFDTPEPPQMIEAAYYKLKVRKFIPAPMRCFKCLKFGHTSLRCRSPGQICSCGLLIHEDSPCQEPPVCVNCADPHSSRSPECMVFKEEKEIQKVKTLQNVPYTEAREIVRSRSYVKPNVSYAVATKTKPVERKDWSKILQPFIFSGSQGPSKPVWMTQELKLVPSPSTPSPPTVAGVSHPPTTTSQGKPLASHPTPPFPTSVAMEQLSQEIPFSTRPKPVRLPQRSPPRKERPNRKVRSHLGLQPVRQESEALVPPPETIVSGPSTAPINWVSSREEHGSDSETGDSNRTVLTDTISAPLERPVVRRKRKGMPKNPKK